MPGMAREVTRQRTLLICKPDAVRRGLIGAVISRLEKKDLLIDAMTMLMPSAAQIRDNYRDNEAQPWFDEMVSYMTSGPIVPIAASGPNAIESGRQIVGDKDVWKSDAGSIRGEYAADSIRTVMHGSRDADEALREIGIWFPQLLGIEPGEIATAPAPGPGLADLPALARANDDFRRVLWTGPDLQVVAMTLLPGQDIGLETHPDTDQLLWVQFGEGEADLNGRRLPVSAGWSVLVPAGTEHNLTNVSPLSPLQLVTVYSRPMHPAGEATVTKGHRLWDGTGQGRDVYLTLRNYAALAER